jgi:hypothetical protein
MSPDRPPASRPEDVTWEQLRESAEGSWRLIGPNSQGGTRLYRYQGQLYTVGYGDYSSLPGGAEQVIAARPDNTPGFPPFMGDGHAAGCCHEPRWDSDWWMHRTFLLKMQQGMVWFFESAIEVWSCSVEAFLQPGAPQETHILDRMGPAVAEEARRCAARRRGR